MQFTIAPWSKWKDRKLHEMIELIKQCSDIAVLICLCSGSLILYKVGPAYFPAVRVITDVPFLVLQDLPKCDIAYCACSKSLVRCLSIRL